MLGSTPKYCTEKSVMLSRNEKKKPAAKATPSISDGLEFSISAIVTAELTNPHKLMPPAVNTSVRVHIWSSQAAGGWQMAQEYHN